MKVLFVMRSPGFLRNFENVIRELLGRGHAVTLLVEQIRTMDARYRPIMAEMRAAGATLVEGVEDEPDVANRAAVQVRLGLDYLRYLEPPYDATPKLRARAAKAAPAPLRRAADLVRDSPDRRARLTAALRALDRSAPISPAALGALREHRPDVLLVTPLVELGAPQADWIRAAAAEGVPSCLGVASWDNLTVKGGLRDVPDRVLVWNPSQVREARALHGVPADRVLATGAHTYDHWFAWRPSRDRAAFCADAGLRADRPFVLYLCSSPFIAPGEAAFARGWIRALRASPHAALREAGVLVRPHPQHAREWAGKDVADLGNAALWPRHGADPVERRSRSDFFDSLFHGAAVVGVNTSAQIEAAIVGRDVLTVLDERYAGTQGGTLHFEHLARPEDGVLTVGRDMAEHLTQLAGVLADPASGEARRRRFLEGFVRPFGLDSPAAPRFADALEEVARARRAPAPPPPAPPAAAAVWRASPALDVVLPVIDSRARRRVGARLAAGARRHTPFTVGRLYVRDVVDGRPPVALRRSRHETPFRDFWRP